jgi:CubicO group peptidase (beta-lactamase class C family)
MANQSDRAKLAPGLTNVRWLPLVLLSACRHHPVPVPSEPTRDAALAPVAADAPLEESLPEAQGLDSRGLVALTEWVRDTDVDVFSILVSRNDKLVYELYTSRFTRDDAHYIMSATKSFLSTLIGIAIDAHLLPEPSTPISQLLPARIFPSDAQRARFATVTLKDVLGMSALDAPVPPHLVNDETNARAEAFRTAPNRAAFALTQNLLPAPGTSFQYTALTPLLATGALEYASHQSAFELATTWLFQPLGFRNAEWMHEDAAGIDNGSYGLRVRPVDMQKLGMLFDDGGVWRGQRIVSEAWVTQSFSPWIRSKPSLLRPNYGWYWWEYHYGPWTAHVANGWKGQRIAVVREERLVITMTGVLEKDEEQIFAKVVQFVQAANRGAPLPPQPDAVATLRARLSEVSQKSCVPRGVESRMVPSIAPKETHHPFAG